MGVRIALVGVCAWTLCAQEPCPSPATYTTCELVFELDDAESKAHPNPYLSVDLHGEFRSPKHRTFKVPAFWDGGRKLVVRMSPVEPGAWVYRVTSNIARFAGKQGEFNATDSGSPGFIKAANVHHWMYTEPSATGFFKGHLWMGDTSYRFATVERTIFDQMIEARSAQKFNHVRGLVLGSHDETATAWPEPDRPNPDYFREVDQRVLAMNGKGIIADLVLAGDQNQLAKLFPTRQQRERYIRYLVARYSAMNITWQGVQEFEEYDNPRELLREIGLLLKKLDPYQHPRSSHTTATSAPLLTDGWMDYVVYQASDDQLGAVESQLFTAPRVNSEFAYEDSGAGRSHAHHVDSDTFRKRLWNAAMNGQYPTFGNTGLYGGRKIGVEAKYLESPGAKAMTTWFDFFSRTRFWELEPFFEVDGARAVALPGVEYVVYVEKPSGPIEVVTERHSYEVYWFNPRTGESQKEKKDYKGERFTGEAPDRAGDWVLHLSRDGRKEGMARSYKFESRANLMQEVEQNIKLAPFEIVEPASDTLTAGQPVNFSVKLKRETRATRSMTYLWTAEATADDQGYRVLATGPKGTFQVPVGVARRFPAVLNVRVTALNANGKAYSLDRVYKLVR